MDCHECIYVLERRDMEIMKALPASVNWHIIGACNYGCIFCFARFPRPQKMLPMELAREIPRLLADQGVKKLNMAGGEPFLHPHIIELLEESKNAGLTTSVITNGSLLDEDLVERIQPFTDWIGLSIDSSDEETQFSMGRGFGDHVERTLENAQLIHRHGIKLKINTVVTSLNLNEDLKPLIRELRPDRWKVFQVLHNTGVNDEVKGMMVTREEFDAYRQRNMTTLSNGTVSVFERDEDMRDTYVMIDPMGRLFHNGTGTAVYMEGDLCSTTCSVPFDLSRYEARGGVYDW